MPRPKVDRVIRSVRLRVEDDALLVAGAEATGKSVNEALAWAVQFTYGMPAPKPIKIQRAPIAHDVPTNFKKG